MVHDTIPPGAYMASLCCGRGQRQTWRGCHWRCNEDLNSQNVIYQQLVGGVIKLLRCLLTFKGLMNYCNGRYWTGKKSDGTPTPEISDLVEIQLLHC